MATWLGVDPIRQPEEAAQAVGLIRLVAPSVVFLGLAGIAVPLLYARQIFGYAAYSPAAFNAGMIVVVIASAPWLGVPG